MSSPNDDGQEKLFEDTFIQSELFIDGLEDYPELKKKHESKEYFSLQSLKQFLKGKNFVLDCGHKITLNPVCGKTMVFITFPREKIICADCYQ